MTPINRRSAETPAPTAEQVRVVSQFDFECRLQGRDPQAEREAMRQAREGARHALPTIVYTLAATAVGIVLGVIVVAWMLSPQ